MEAGKSRRTPLTPVLTLVPASVTCFGNGTFADISVSSNPVTGVLTRSRKQHVTTDTGRAYAATEAAGGDAAANGTGQGGPQPGGQEGARLRDTAMLLSVLRNRGTVTSCCLKPPSLPYFARAALRPQSKW
uniref:Uncharacterized protein n=1 Tax=Rangifer tarandus platyrhynchus TaxID=3082113 RepID=A0ACB0EQI9_RANTA|nr:unnamed protein product [Rangifer tarandus platyrhynchus]